MNLTELKSKYDNYLVLNYNSKRTISSYKNCFERFVSDNSRIYRMSKDEIKSYLIQFSQKYSISYFNQMLSSIRIIYRILGQPHKTKSINYKKDSIKEISILSTNEIKKSSLTITNIKHRCIINLLYIGALRISELQNIKLSDIDSERKVILIHESKGGKSRKVPISEMDLAELRNYYRIYRTKTYLFEGVKRGSKYSLTSIRNVVKKIKTNKHVYPHLLRHTALTNLIDKGHNILQVQNFAGHSSPKSTERYYHLSDRALEGMTLTLKEAV